MTEQEKYVNSYNPEIEPEKFEQDIADMNAMEMQKKSKGLLSRIGAKIKDVAITLAEVVGGLTCIVAAVGTGSWPLGAIGCAAIGVGANNVANLTRRETANPFEGPSLIRPEMSMNEERDKDEPELSRDEPELSKSNPEYDEQVNDVKENRETGEQTEEEIKNAEKIEEEINFTEKRHFTNNKERMDYTVNVISSKIFNELNTEENLKYMEEMIVKNEGKRRDSFLVGDYQFCRYHKDAAYIVKKDGVSFFMRLRNGDAFTAENFKKDIVSGVKDFIPVNGLKDVLKHFPEEEFGDNLKDVEKLAKKYDMYINIHSEAKRAEIGEKIEAVVSGKYRRQMIEIDNNTLAKVYMEKGNISFRLIDKDTGIEFCMNATPQMLVDLYECSMYDKIYDRGLDEVQKESKKRDEKTYDIVDAQKFNETYNRYRNSTYIDIANEKERDKAIREELAKQTQEAAREQEAILA